MRLGAPLYDDTATPEAWIAALKRRQFRAAYCPLGVDASQTIREEYAQAAREADVVIAEVGAWCNPLSPNTEEAASGFALCVDSLRLADEIGARCCVNISGNQGAGAWDGPDPANLTDAAFDRVVASMQRIIDTAAPERADYCLEPMPWMYPHSVASYVSIIEAVDRDRFAVHFDPVNLLNSLEKHYASGELIREFVAKLGDRTRSVHAKDQKIDTALTLRLDEAPPGEGDLDFDSFLEALAGLDPDLPLLVEHLDSPEAYERAVGFLRERAAKLSLSL